MTLFNEITSFFELCIGVLKSLYMELGDFSIGRLGAGKIACEAGVGSRARMCSIEQGRISCRWRLEQFLKFERRIGISCKLVTISCNFVKISCRLVKISCTFVK